MKFKTELLIDYKTLIHTTNLQQAYQEFIYLFRFLRVELEKQLPDFKFQGNISENAMDYSYFQLTNPQLKEKGLKIVVVFVHQDFQFEIWLSGINRKIQNQYYNLWKSSLIPFHLTNNPNRNDYILKYSLGEDLIFSEGSILVLEIKKVVMELLEFVISLS